MRSLTRLLATTVAGLAVAAGTVVAATPAQATGEGCVGVPSVPAAYVCVVSLTPTNAVPTVTSTPYTVTVPSVCYYLGCTGDKPVTVPIPGVAEGSGQIALLYYNGVYYPIAVSSGGVVATVGTVVQLVGDTAANAVYKACNTVNNVTYKYLHEYLLACEIY
jgi:hypothetical protein